MALSQLVLLILAAQQAAPSEPSDGRPLNDVVTLEPVARDSLSQPLVAADNSSSSSRDYSDRVNDEANDQLQEEAVENDDEDIDDDDEDDDDRISNDDQDDDNDDDERHEGGGGHQQKHKKGHKKKTKKKKKKKGHHGFFSLVKKMKKHLPEIVHKMHGPSMFMMGMAQANFHNFVMHALMMSKMALTTVVVMILREMVFGDKDQPVKYYNFGYDHHRRRTLLHDSPYDYSPRDYARRRRKRRLAHP